MIGVIGPQDSVELALAIAAEENRGAQVASRVYKHSRDTAALARELDQSCQVLLFTGRVPFESLSGIGLDAELQYVSHSGADLYRCISLVLIEESGRMPRVSIDSIDATTATEAFRDLGLPDPVPAPLTSHDGAPAIDTEAITAFHIEQHASGAAGLAFTCLAEVRAALAKANVPVRRVEHTKATMRAALRNAVLADELHRTRAAQPAVALFRIESDPRSGSDPYARESSRLQAQTALLQIARKNGGRLSTLEPDLYSVTTNRGAIDTALARRRAGHSSLLDPPQLSTPVAMGVGIGDTYAHAETNARAATAMSRTHDRVVVIFPDGHVDSGDTAAQGQLHQQDVTDGYVKLGERLGMGALAARRLVQALGRVDAHALTARQLGESYGVQTRSARRLLTSLADAGFAEEIGIRARPQAGRPQTLYRVDVAAIMAQLSTEAVGG